MSVFGSIWTGIAKEKQDPMNIVKYQSATEITAEATKRKLLDKLYDSGLSLSFRTYDQEGQTLEFHVFYFEDSSENNFQTKESKINFDEDFSN